MIIQKKITGSGSEMLFLPGSIFRQSAPCKSIDVHIKVCVTHLSVVQSAVTFLLCEIYVFRKGSGRRKKYSSTFVRITVLLRVEQKYEISFQYWDYQVVSQGWNFVIKCLACSAVLSANNTNTASTRLCISWMRMSRREWRIDNRRLYRKLKIKSRTCLSNSSFSVMAVIHLNACADTQVLFTLYALLD